MQSVLEFYDSGELPIYQTSTAVSSVPGEVKCPEIQQFVKALVPDQVGYWPSKLYKPY